MDIRDLVEFEWNPLDPQDYDGQKEDINKFLDELLRGDVNHDWEITPEHFRDSLLNLTHNAYISYGKPLTRVE